MVRQMTKEELRQVYQDAYNAVLTEDQPPFEVTDEQIEALYAKAHDAGLWAVYQVGHQDGVDSTARPM